MNWILDTYSSVYHAAMMQPRELAADVAPAKGRVQSKRAMLLGLIRRSHA